MVTAAVIAGAAKGGLLLPTGREAVPMRFLVGVAWRGVRARGAACGLIFSLGRGMATGGVFGA